MKGLIKAFATHQVAVSGKAAEDLYGSDWKNGNKNIIMHCGVETENTGIGNLRKEYRVGLKRTIVGHVGRFVHEKNHDFLLSLFSEYQKIDPASYLVLIGDGPLKHEIELRVRKEKINNVIFTGPRSDVLGLMRGFDLMVFPSKTEGLPLSVVEAQLMGVPVVMSDVITSEVEFVPGLVKRKSLNDPKKTWVEAMALVANKRPKAPPLPERKRMLARKGFSIESNIQLLNALYRGVRNLKHPHGGAD